MTSVVRPSRTVAANEDSSRSTRRQVPLRDGRESRVASSRRRVDAGYTYSTQDPRRRAARNRRVPAPARPAAASDHEGRMSPNPGRQGDGRHVERVDHPAPLGGIEAAVVDESCWSGCWRRSPRSGFFSWACSSVSSHWARCSSRWGRPVRGSPGRWGLASGRRPRPCSGFVTSHGGVARHARAG
jgi:hypothetical protein